MSNQPDNEPELFQCSGCYKRFFADGFRVTRLGRRCKTCLECAVRQKNKNGNRQCKHGRSRLGCEQCDNYTPAPRQCSHGIRRDCAICDRVAEFGRVVLKRFAKVLTSKDRGGRSTNEILGCDIPTLLSYLESKFTPEMTWGNYGSIWHLGYIVSLASNPESSRAGKYEPPTMAVKMSRLHYENLTPKLALIDWSQPPTVHTARQPPAPAVTSNKLTDDEVTVLLTELGL